MQEPLSFGYCTNVHAGTDLESAKANLKSFATPVRELVCPCAPLPVGLWLAENAAATLRQPGEIERFRDWLAENSFLPYTLNGFPQGDFHQSVVKHDVYSPTWLDRRRLDYTVNLARGLDQLLPPGLPGSISTLPLGWPSLAWGKPDFEAAAANFHRLAQELNALSQSSGRELVVAIEPEPGCVLNTAAEVCEFFSKYLLGGENEALVRRHITVCHDVCHSGVMFESQTAALQSYLDLGIRIGKVQVSSAVHVPWDEAQTIDQHNAIANQLRTFNEPKYLHQTTRSQNAQLAEIVEDLPIAIDSWLQPEDVRISEPWRVHFHVPIFVDRFDALGTTQADILKATSFLEKQKESTIDGAPWFLGHYEVETYAWPVLPASLATENLSAGIAKELSFFDSVLCNARTTA